MQTPMPNVNSHAGVKVWLVDDNDKLRQLVADLLQSMNGIQCDRQFSSPTALLSTLASKIGPDVILLDVHMGKENGVEAVRAIKSLARSTRVLMFTTCFDAELKQRALSEGASDFLNKGTSLDRLEQCIRQRDEMPKYPTPRRRGRAVASGREGDKAIECGPVARGLGFIRALWN